MGEYHEVGETLPEWVGLIWERRRNTVEIEKQIKNKINLFKKNKIKVKIIIIMTTRGSARGSFWILRDLSRHHSSRPLSR